MITRSDPPAQKKKLATAPFQKLENPLIKMEHLSIITKCNVIKGHLTPALRQFKVPKNRRKSRDLGISTQNQEMFDKNTNVARVIISAIILCGK